MKLFWEFTAQYPGLLVSLLLGQLIARVARTLACPLLIGEVLDNALRKRGFEAFLFLAITIVVFILGEWVGTVTEFQQGELVARVIAERLRPWVTEKVLQQDLGFFWDHLGGALESACEKLKKSYESVAPEIVSQLISFLVDFVLCLVVVWFLMPSLTVALALWGGLYIFLVYRRSLKRVDLQQQTNKQDNKIIGLATDAIGAVKVIKSFTAELAIVAHYKRATKDWLALRLMLLGLIRKQVLLMDVIAAATTGTFLCLGVLGVLQSAISAGTLVALFQYVRTLTGTAQDGSLAGFGRFLDMLQTQCIQAQPAIDAAQRRSCVQDPPKPRRLKPGQLGITFEDVWFAYPGRKPLFKGLNLEIKAGKRVAIIGPTGAGKSTIASLIMRFVDPTDNGQGHTGAVRVGGENVTQLSQHELRREIGFVPQEHYLLHQSIRENLVIGKPDASEEEIVATCTIAQIHDFITQLPEGYDSTVGERGVKLSGGEQQRLSLARALLKNPRILILDEATSSLDVQTEYMIKQVLEEVMKERTCVIIAHRVSTVRDCGLIVVLGEIRDPISNDTYTVIQDCGTHNQLLSRNPFYLRSCGLRYD